LLEDEQIKTMLDNTKNSTCDFAEELVSYLYEEMSSADKSRFEKHLKDCLPCRDELAEFSLARVAVQEWRDEEFAPLANPAIEIPYPAKSSRSWLAQIREYFTLSPAWMTASTALAALAICVGLFVIMFNSMPDGNDVVVQDKNIKTVQSPTTGNQKQNSNISETNQNQPTTNISSEPPVKIDTPKPIKTVNEPTKISVPSVSKPQNLPVKTVQPRNNKKTTVQPPVKTNKQKVPRLIDEDEEEDSLTLTDLLEDIGAREIDD
jgi:hypothetical protein